MALKGSKELKLRLWCRAPNDAIELKSTMVGVVSVAGLVAVTVMVVDVMVLMVVVVVVRWWRVPNGLNIFKTHSVSSNYQR